MAFDLLSVSEAVQRHGRVARVVIAEVAGSSPREPGAAMLVWNGGQSGTIGGGALEYEAAARAFSRVGASRHALGPELGQCCGGAVTLWTEIWDARTLHQLDPSGPVARGPGDQPLAVTRLLERARSRGATLAPGLVNGWMIESMAQPILPLWIWGAGHVGRALVDVLAPLPELAITWIDTSADRFPDDIARTVTVLPAADPALALHHAPSHGAHLILTYSHALDLALCHAALNQEFAFCGLIGSQTKHARFRSRLRQLGHSAARINAITCPIGQKALGKHPQAIAIGVATEILALTHQHSVRNDRDGDLWPIHCSASKA